MPVFDPLVFDTAFDIIDPIPTLLKVSIEPEHKKVVIGQGVNITIYIVNLSTTPTHRFLFNPSGIPTITITNPLGIVLVNAQNMIAYNTGIFTYNYTIPVSAAPGGYIGSFSCLNGAHSMQTDTHELFEVI